MTQYGRITPFLLILCLVLLLSSVGCAPTQSPSFRSSFFAPSAPSADIEPGPASVAQPNLFAKEMPNPLPPVLKPAGPTETELRMMRAQERVEAGKKAYEQGDFGRARAEFDAAIDLLLSTPDNAPDRSRIERRLEQVADTIYRYDVGGLGSGEDWDKVVYDKSPLDGMLELTFPLDPRLKPKVTEELRATASELPLEENGSVLNYIHFFSTDRGRKVLVAGLRRAGRYKPLIGRILSEEGVPQELMFLAQAESGFLPRAVSYKQAAGMWQFVSWRGREYGLDQGPGFDERLDPEKATRAAARHLHDLYSQFGDWYLAMAAYNCGPGCVDRAVQRTGYADYWRLVDLGALPKETTNYVPLILAMTIMAKNPKDYGLEDVEIDAPLQYETVKLDAPTNLALVADATDRTVSEIRELNPSLLKSVAPVGYELRLPSGTLASLTAALEAIPANRRVSWRVHKVGAGETLASIARQYRTAVGSIADANPQALDGPAAGEMLIIPAVYQDDTPKGVKSKGRKTVAASRAHSRGGVSRAAASKPARVKTAGLRRVSASSR